MRARVSAAAGPANWGPPLGLRLRRLMRGTKRAALWGSLVVLASATYSLVSLTRQPGASGMLAATTDRAIAISAALGLGVTDIEVEGRETTDAATIMRALAADRGTPILAIS